MDVESFQNTCREYCERHVLYNASWTMPLMTGDSCDWLTRPWGDDDVDDAFAALDADEQEVFEVWAVSDHLAYKLRQHGEQVLPCCMGNDLWLRCCTGQAIYIDSVIEKIVEEVTKCRTSILKTKTS